MAKGTETTPIEFNIHAHISKLTGQEEISRSVEEAFRSSGLSEKEGRAYADALKKGLDGASTQFHRLMATTRPAGMTRDMDALQKKWKAFTQEQAGNLLDIAQKEAAIRSGTGGASATDALYAARVEQSIRVDTFEKEMEILSKQVKIRAQDISDVEDFFRKDSAEKTAAGLGLADSFVRGLDKVDLTDMKGFASAFTGAVGKVGAGMQVAGGSLAAKGGAAGKVGGMASGMGTALSGVALPLAAIAGSLAIIVGLFAMADKQTKDFNKEILAGAGNADFLLSKTGEGFEDLDGTLADVRKAAYDIGWEFRMQPAEVMKIVSAANEAGFTFREMEQAMGGVAHYMRQVVSWSKAMGISVEEGAKATAEWQQDFSGGAQMIDESFAAIVDVAGESGIGVKRLFGMVMQAQGGMALFSGRIEQVADTIGLLSTALGEAAAAEYTAGLTKGFAAEGYTERFKRILLTGQPQVDKIMATNASTISKSFMRSMENASPEIQSSLRSALSGVGISFEDLASGNVEALRRLASLPPEQGRALLAGIQKSDAVLGRDFADLLGATEALKGGMENTAKGMDELGPGGVLAMQMSQAMSVFGKPISELSGMQLAAFESFSGVSGEQLHALQRMDQSLRAEWELAKKEGEFTGTFQDYLMTSKSAQERLAKSQEVAMSVQDAMSKEIVSNTTSISALMSTVVAQGFEGVQTLLQYIYNWISGPVDAGKSQAIDAYKTTIEGMRAELKVTAQELSAARQGVNIATSPEKKEAAEKELDRLTEIEAQQKATLATKQRDLDTLRGKSAPGMFVAGFQSILGGPEGLAKNLGLSDPGQAAGFGSESVSAQRAQAEALDNKVTQPLGELGQTLTKEQEDQFKKWQTLYPDMTVKAFLEAMDRKEQQDVASMVAAGGGSYFDAMASMRGGTGLSAEDLRYAEAGKAIIGGTASPMKFAAKQNDFLYRAGQGVTPIHSSDDLLGGKPGGPLASALAGGGGNVTIHIHGGDEARVYAVVKKAMQESGIRPRPGGR